MKYPGYSEEKGPERESGYSELAREKPAALTSLESAPETGLSEIILRKLRAFVLVSIILCLANPEYLAADSPDESREEYGIWPEIFIPGYNAFRNESYISGGLLLLGRLITLYGAYHYHNRYINYNSAANAARIADLYYGPGLEYADPYSGDYLSSQQMENRAGRAQNYSHLSIALHLGLTGAGLFQGYRIQEGIREHNLQELKIKQVRTKDLPVTLGYTWNLNFSE
ncbi:MAG TPA: hypothetical protein DEA96_15410 [Leptospiraceae bacterium]|nr:hypothetical protein [Spirochaetaceae bacterium]HBS06355.1 hypothetical protein [Leptospiraceae bacterium]|tara:strand:+ start:18984 stop:19664 length:681 start_codon:yes stop_codon:yes gene_type:complete